MLLSFIFKNLFILVRCSLKTKTQGFITEALYTSRTIPEQTQRCVIQEEDDLIFTLKLSYTPYTVGEISIQQNTSTFFY